jgi:hypothetical protein
MFLRLETFKPIGFVINHIISIMLEKGFYSHDTDYWGYSVTGGTDETALIRVLVMFLESRGIWSKKCHKGRFRYPWVFTV